jgi:hypothetical protein
MHEAFAAMVIHNVTARVHTIRALSKYKLAKELNSETIQYCSARYIKGCCLFKKVNFLLSYANSEIRQLKHIQNFEMNEYVPGKNGENSFERPRCRWK